MAPTPDPQRGSDDITELLRAWSDGNQRALGELTPIVYHELHRLAGRYLRREREGHSLQATALVTKPICVWWVTPECDGSIAHTSSPYQLN
nr:hypothetical protein Hi04_10k_c3826_00014 [uncultured bacterium]